MKLLWLGQSGLLFDFDGLKVMIDPYLTDSLAEQGKEFTRKTKINKKLFGAKPDIIILTTGHLDHTDDGSIERLLKHMGRKKRATILSCESVYDYVTTVPKMSDANHIMLEKYSEWTVGNINIRAVPAKTDDKTAFGVVITDFASGKKYYVAGDTLYNSRVIESLPKDIYAAFLPINGEYGSMNVLDAKRFAMAIKPQFCVPVHFGMFDKINPNTFDLPNAIIPKAYKVINFDDYETPKNEELKKDSDDVEDFSTEDNKNDDCGDKTDAPDDAGFIVFDFDCDEFDSKIVDEAVDETADETVDEVVDKVVDEAVDETVDEAVDEVTDEIDINTINEADAGNGEVDKLADEVVSEIVSEAINEAFNEIDEADDFDDADSSKDYGVVDEVDKAESGREKLNDEDKIDAYIREIEKFERGETADFSKIDD